MMIFFFRSKEYVMRMPLAWWHTRTKTHTHLHTKRTLNTWRQIHRMASHMCNEIFTDGKKRTRILKHLDFIELKNAAITFELTHTASSRAYVTFPIFRTLFPCAKIQHIHMFSKCMHNLQMDALLTHIVNN